MRYVLCAMLVEYYLLFIQTVIGHNTPESIIPYVQYNTVQYSSVQSHVVRYYLRLHW